MFTKLFLLWCLAGILSASHVQKRSPPVKKSPPVNVSVAQPQYTIPVNVQFSRTHTLNVHPATGYSTHQQVVQAQGTPNVYAYAAGVPSYTINPAIVKTVSTPVVHPGENNVAVEAYVTAHPPSAYVSSNAVPVPVHPLHNEVQGVVNEPAIQYVSAPLQYSNVAHPNVQVEPNLVYETVTAHPPNALYVNPQPLQPVHHIQPVAERPVIQYINAPVTPGVNFAPVHAAVSIDTGNVNVEAHHPVTAHTPAAAYVTSTPVPAVTHVESGDHNNAVPYIKAPVTPVNLTPEISENTVSIGGKQVAYQAQQTVTVQPHSPTFVTSTPVPQTHNVHTVAHGPPVQYVNTPAVQYVNTPVAHPALNIVPIAAKQISIEDLQSELARLSHPVHASPSPVLLNPPVNHPPLQLVRNPEVQTVHHSVPPVGLAPIVVPEPVQHIEAVHHPEPVQYISQNQPHLVNPVEASNIVEPHRSAHYPSNLRPVPQVYPQVHPHVHPHANHQVIQYVSVPSFNAGRVHKPAPAAHPSHSLLHYPTSPIVQKPIPVFYSAEEPEDLGYKHYQNRPVAYGHESSFHQPIPVPVIYPKADNHINFNQRLSSQLFYAKLAAKDQNLANLLAKHLRPGGHSKGRTHSPSSSVSRVNFNGLGVSYGW